MDLASGRVRKQYKCKRGQRPPTPRNGMSQIAATLDDALGAITDGCMLVVPREVSGVPMDGDARADPARHQAAASGGAADVEPASRPADRRRLRRDFGDQRRQPRRIRPGAALHRRHSLRRDQDEGRHLPGAACCVAGGRERRAVHAAARADRFRRSEISRRLEGDRQSVRRRRSDRAAAGDQAGRGAVSCGDGRCLRQCLDRPAARTRHHGACGGEDRRDGRPHSSTAICWTTRCWRPARCPASMSTASR